MQQENHNHPVIVIGTSSGGLAALREFLAELPSDFNAAVFVTMHIGDQPSALPSLLTQSSQLPVGFALSQEQVVTGRVYIAPPDKHLLVKKGAIQITRSAKENHSRPAIDPMFRSAAISYGSNAIGVLMTGELDDGVVGLQAIKAYGGLAFVQDPETAEAPSMPTNALRHVSVDGCLPLTELAKRLVQIINQRTSETTAPSASNRIEPFATENDLAEDFSKGGSCALNEIGQVAGMSCPECGGALWEVAASSPRFRCHTGHAYTAAALFQAQNETIEEALWVAIRALHEKQLLLGRLMQSSKDAGRKGALREYELASDGLESHKATLRALLTSLRPT
ncbi:MAG: chemotaxis protein CheB [Dehalococcoidia bacterium]|jgi:two-component system, chemotaxis family, protein-glutamate methylesterase/glutaminase|uniref:protein-glutamate methylesterase n=1 Tax=Pseudomonas moraviensis R28-S TaxID=1395516 RepID=V8R405_9PSED|nr:MULTISPECIES: chemotaxis protein CheB [Pseudomonas]ETF06388.1 chemotaxis protein CheB [Pseudomonas moraviensis R28-S]